MKVRSCVSPEGFFVYGVHQPRYRVANLRRQESIGPLGTLEDGTIHENRANFPPGPVEETGADWVFEVPNPFPFRGTTYIGKAWADARAADPAGIGLPLPARASLTEALEIWSGDARLSPERLDQAFRTMPEPLLLATAATSTDPEDLLRLAHLCCTFSYDLETGQPTGLQYQKDERGRIRAVISNHTLFEVLVNNPYLPDHYKEMMVLRPGVQGGSEIVGDWANNSDSRIFEYLRRNSYIPWGHYAANLANDTVRYRIGDLRLAELKGLRHLYYQRTFVRLAEMLAIPLPAEHRCLTAQELEELRGKILEKLNADRGLEFTATLWGWNFGFDYAPSGYRLHASHQQIHQQYAMLPGTVAAWCNGTAQPDRQLKSYGCGDLVVEFIETYRQQTGRDFFEAYLEAIRANQRLDGRKGETSLVVYEDSQVMLFVPKAQTSQWELQLMPLRPVGNIVEADGATRNSLDRAMLIAMGVLTGLGARLITTIEFPKRFGMEENGQHLLYSFLPRLPESPGAFSEAQLRFINGHYPEDFAAACRSKLPKVEELLAE